MKINEIEIIIKKSKFIGLHYQIEAEDQAKDIIKNIKKEHKKATHVTFAYILNTTARKSDDGEPSGTAGNPIYTILERKKLTKNLVIVIRYYGGIKLGGGGLIRSYSKCANEVTN